MTSFLSALLLALGLSLGAGPGLVLQIDSAVSRGFKGGALVVLGLYSADLILLSIAGLGVSSVVQSRNWQLVMGMVGGAVLCAMGVRLFLKKPRIETSKHAVEDFQQIHHYLTLFFKGAIVNITNPTIIFYWLTLTGVTISTYGYASDDYYFFFITLFCVSITLDMIKVWAISRYHTFLGFRLLLLTNRLLGTALVGIGIFFCVRAMTTF